MRMSIDALKNNLTNPARAYRWEIVIPNLPGGGDEDSLELRGYSSVIPGRSVGEILVPFKGTAGMKVPGKLDLTHNWPVTFWESESDKKTFDALHSWQELIINAETGIGTPDPTLKTDLYLRCLKATDTSWLKIKLVGCYVQSVDDAPLTWEAEDLISFSSTFSYDYWKDVT